MSLKTLANQAKSAAFWLPFLDFVFPPECMGCQEGLGDHLGLMWCENCLKQLCSDPEKCCPACGAEKTPPVFPNGRCRLCRDIKIKFERAICLGNYHSLMQNLIVKLKANFDDSLALQFGMLLGKRLQADAGFPACDLIVPTPTYWWNRLRRPSYLAAVIAEGVSRQLVIPVELDVIRCVRKTKKQGTLDTISRFKNVQDAFAVKRAKQVVDKTVLVVDDVITSGATANQLSTILRKAGATKVYVAAIARGVRQT
jgi:ComF family protein